MLKTMVVIWCDYTDTRCIRKVTGDTTLRALDYARMNGWFIQGHRHLCPYHKPKGK
jgi:hypothetical protein